MIKHNIFDEFSIASQEILLQNNINDVVELEYAREGYEVLGVVNDFLELCAYFSIVFIWDKEDGACCKLIIDPTGYIDSEDRIDLYNAYNKKLCPIAYLGWGGAVMIDENENVYLFEDGTLDFLGNSLISGIEEIFKGRSWRLNQ
jgi:SUKH-3 immunity protein